MNFKHLVLLFALIVCVFASKSKSSMKHSLRKLQKKYAKKLATYSKASSVKVQKATPAKTASVDKVSTTPAIVTLASNTTATNSTTPSVVSSKITDVTSKTGSERANKKAIKKDDQYQWLKKFVSEEEKKMKRKEKREQEAKKAQMGKVLNSTLLDQMVAAQQAKLQEEKAKSEKNSGSFNIYKVDNSWSAYFLSFFGQPTKTQLDPENVLTKALINSGKVESHVETDGKTGETYLAIVDKE